MDQAQIIGWLRGSAAFSGADEQTLVELAAAFRNERAVAAGTEIVHEGEIGDDFYLVAKGSMKVVAEKDGEERYLGNISTGETFGEIASLTGGRRLATVRATEDSTLLILHQKDFQDLLHHHPALAETVLRSLERYLLP